MKKFLYLFALTVFVSMGLPKNSGAQDYLHCGIQDAMNELFRDHPEAEVQNEQLRKSAQQNFPQFKMQHPNALATAPMYIIPVVFHIIHQHGAEDLSDAQVQDQVNILNRDYRLQNADTANTSWPMKYIYSDTKIEFRLATKDPDGNCTNGIVHYYSHKTNQANDASKLDPWPREKYLNVWVVKTIGSSGVAGYAYYPSSVTGILFTIDGILILHDYIGSIGTSNVNQSRALTHEIGHYLSLAHVWGSTNQPGVACGDDGIGDTPGTKGWSNCPILQPPLYMNRVVCSLPNDTIVENVENYMEYSYCSVMFSADQTTTMQQTLNSAVSFRNNLGTYSNHVATGTDTASLTANPYTFPTILNNLPVCVPVADFSASRYYVCQGGTITFTDHSWRAPVTSRMWTFTNGTPATSTASAPTITFNTWGWQDVTLDATNASGTGTLFKHNYVFVSPPWADYFGTFSEGFENTNFQNLWIVENMEDSYPQWTKSTQTGYTGTSCVKLNAYGTEKNLVDAFISPTFDLSTCSNATLNFEYSCASTAQLSTDITEKMMIYSSVNCGQSWNLRKVLSGANLCNAGYYPNGFLPNSQSQWRSCVVTLNASDMKPNVRFRFEYTAGNYSNNIYVDDINIAATVGMSEIQNYAFGLDIYPNPSGNSELINIGYSLISTENICISLFDITGRETIIHTSKNLAPGDHYFILDRKELGLEAGVYLVRISNERNYETRKLVITE